MFPASTLSFLMVGLLQAMSVHAEPSLICTLPFACGLTSLKDEVQTLPSGWTHSWLLGTLPVSWYPPPDGACSLSSLRDEVRALPGGWAHSPRWCL